MSFDPGAPGRHDYLPERGQFQAGLAHELIEEQRYELPAMWPQSQMHPGKCIPILLNRSYEATRCDVICILANCIDVLWKGEASPHQPNSVPSEQHLVKAVQIYLRMCYRVQTSDSKSSQGTTPIHRICSLWLLLR
jgi:hypothetical protein